MLYVNAKIQIPPADLTFTFSRSGGPGGQNVNKVNSKAILRWPIFANNSLPYDVRARFLEKYKSRLTVEGDLIISSQKYRDQPSNIQDCLDKLKEMLLSVAEKPVERRPTRPTLGSKERRTESKQAHSQKKQQRRMPITD
jgi:ribosome-associated protein